MRLAQTGRMNTKKGHERMGILPNSYAQIDVTGSAKKVDDQRKVARGYRMVER